MYFTHVLSLFPIYFSIYSFTQLFFLLRMVSKRLSAWRHSAARAQLTAAPESAWRSCFSARRSAERHKVPAAQAQMAAAQRFRSILKAF